MQSQKRLTNSRSSYLNILRGIAYPRARRKLFSTSQSICRSYSIDEVRLFTEKLNLKRKHKGGPIILHQDFPYWTDLTKAAPRVATAMLFLDDAHAKSIQGPATMDGIGPTQGWEIYWMEVDVKRRRGAPWAAPVPQDIAGKVPHLTAAE